MIDRWTAVWLRVFDALLGWMLFLPRDLAVVLLATMTALFVAIVRRLLIDREVMGLIRADRRDLRRLISTARVMGDESAVKRYQRLRTRVASLQLRQELPVSIVVLLPLVGLLTWAGHRLYFELPPRQGPIRFVVWLPASSIDELVHVVPQMGLSADDGWIRQVTKASRNSVTRGKAEWILTGPDLEKNWTVVLRYGNETIRRDLSYEQLVRGDLSRLHAADVETEVSLREYLPFNSPVFARLGIPPWSILYSLVVLLIYAVLSLVAWRGHASSPGLAGPLSNVQSTHL